MIPAVKRQRMAATNNPDASMQNESTSVMAAGAKASVSVAVHPLVIMNVSEHFTRVRAQENKTNPKVFGALLGKQDGRNLELFNSFELQFDIVDEDVVINMNYFKTKEEQFHQVFKDLDFLGWYTTGTSPNEHDIKVHCQMCSINDSSLFLKLNPFSRADNLPLSVFESVIDIVEGEPRVLFVEVAYTLATEEAERIGVDHVARVSTSEHSEGVSAVADHLQAQYSAIKMLYTRVKTILDYIRAVKAGETPLVHEIMRDCRSLCQRLPVLDTEQFNADFFDQCNDVMLMTYLATITKGCNSANEVISKFNLTYDRLGSRRLRGMMF